LICIGGSDATQHHASAFSLRWVKGHLEGERLPDFPHPCANMSCALQGDTIYVVGGVTKPDSTNALNSLFTMNLADKEPRWQKLESNPGPGRIFPTAGACNGSFYLFGGAALKAGPDGKPLREWLRDAYCYTPGRGWKRIADLPRVAVAAPSPAPLVDGKLLIIGGDDGAQVNTQPTEHKGFPRSVLAYDPKADKWERLEDAPFSFVTTTAISWRNRIVIPGGEIRPGVRSSEVWALNYK
jgi:N-acetylneuraminic acid mutarotase